MTLSIVITTRNRIKDLKACIESIKNSRIDFSWELIIVDDNSSDETRQLQASDLELKNARVVHNENQQMMVRSRNSGAKLATGSFILFIDDDNVVDADMIKKLVDFARSQPKYGIIGPSMYYSGSKKKYLDYQKINLYTGKTASCIDNSERKICESDGIPNIFLVKKEIFSKCNYFDEELVQTYTEPDFAFSVRKSGYGCATIKEARTYHNVFFDNYGPVNLGGRFSQKAYCLMRNRTVIVSRYGNLVQKIVYLVLFSWFWPLAYSILMLRCRRFDLIKLYWMGFRDGILYFFSGKLRNSLPITK